nr:transcription-repair coupling factor [Anaerolineae bacterium]
YLPWMDDPEVSLLDYAPGDTVVLVDGWQELVDAIDDLETQAISLREARQESGLIPGDMPLPYLTRDYLVDAIRQARSINLGNPPDAALAEQVMEGLGDLFLPGPRYAGELRVFLDHLKELSRPEQENVIVVSRQAERLAGLLQERVVGFRPTAGDDLVKMPSGEPVFVSGALAEGWILSTENSRVHLLTDAEIFGWKRPEPRRRRQPRPVAPESFYADLKPGDYVVHVEHGIGQFVGLDKRVLGGVEREYLQVTYGGGNVLYVPIHQADRMSRYIGVDDSPPALSRLGTPDWGRIKERTQQAVEEIARDLLDLYASREAVVGHAFPPDTPWQHELEASFPYVETEDQLRALAEVKEDMERPRPMDRLICGDVGYGKTEVALRAAFKAVMGGKQVAVLVPTTVLAQQHYDTFRLRLAAFPVEIEMLSRFRTRGQQDEVIDRLQGGTVDIVIGTHRLLSGDVAFHDLGLLIIDEEQRFGVTHKEQLKKMRTEVDVLTLTATPIPRTLWMSLTGVRDISVIDTAPEERLPVRTYVGRRNNDLIRDAVLRELDRGGQVFYVHNRVQTIYSEVARLKQVVPEATFAVGHGQMNEHELESVMARFGQGEIDVLVSTSIIEAGLDFPNANTLVVDRADRFGLSQLYQLRGRVGRSANRAFAYFFYPSRGAITPEARARLDTIDEYTDLGSGMNIAMRDLEIRGAGDILGLRQSGHISAVGFNLYTRMLAEAVRRVRSEREGGKPALEMGELPQEPITIDLPLPTYIPTDYVPDMALRIQLYRRMAELYTLEAVEEFGAELADRFGPLPPPVENLLFQLRVKQLAHHSRVSSIMAEGNQINVRLAGLAHVDRNSMQRQMGQGIRVSRTGIWLPRDLDDWRPLLIDVLSQLQSISPTET